MVKISPESCPFSAVIRVNAICDHRIHDETSGEVRPLETVPGQLRSFFLTALR